MISTQFLYLGPGYCLGPCDFCCSFFLVCTGFIPHTPKTPSSLGPLDLSVSVSPPPSPRFSFPAHWKDLWISAWPCQKGIIHTPTLLITTGHHCSSDIACWVPPRICFRLKLLFLPICLLLTGWILCQSFSLFHHSYSHWATKQELLDTLSLQLLFWLLQRILRGLLLFPPLASDLPFSL